MNPPKYNHEVYSYGLTLELPVPNGPGKPCKIVLDEDKIVLHKKDLIDYN